MANGFSPAGAALSRWRRPEHDAARFATLRPPAFLFLHGPRSQLSSTELRRAAEAGADVPSLDHKLA